MPKKSSAWRTGKPPKDGVYWFRFKERYKHSTNMYCIAWYYHKSEEFEAINVGLGEPVVFPLHSGEWQGPLEPLP